MSQAYADRSRAEPQPRPTTRREDTECAVESAQLLSLLGDEYTREVLQAISEAAAPAKEIAEEINVSRTTVYRRLDRLKEAGLVRASMVYDPSGHHKQQYEVAVDRIQLNLDDGSLEVGELA